MVRVALCKDRLAQVEVYTGGGEGGSSRVIGEAIFMTRLPKHHLHIERPVGWARLGTRRVSRRDPGRRGARCIDWQRAGPCYPPPCSSHQGKIRLKSK